MLDIFASDADLFRYAEEPPDPVAAPAPKPAKTPKPAAAPATVLSHQNELGFHTSTIRKAMETWQPKGSPDQLLAHLGKHAGANEEAGHVGLPDFLKDKKSITREDVLRHLDQSPHQVEMEETGPDDGGEPKWYVSDGNGESHEYRTEQAAEQAADLANSDARDDYENDFKIESQATEPKHTINKEILNEMADEKVKPQVEEWLKGWRVENLGGTIQPNWRAIPPPTDELASRADQMSSFETKEEAEAAVRATLTHFARNQSGLNDAIKGIPDEHDSEDDVHSDLHDLMSEHFPEQADKSRRMGYSGLYDTETGEESWRVTESPLGRQRHQRYFGDSYESEEEAQDEVREYINEHFELPYTHYQGDESEGGGNHFEEYSLDGPKEDYQETHVGVPGLRETVKQRPLLTRESVSTKIMPGDSDSILLQISAPEGVMPKGTLLEELRLPKDIDHEGIERNVKMVLDYENARIEARNQGGGRTLSWKDGHGDFHHIENPVVRLRHDTRETTDGKSMFFLEELQGPSDANQEKMPKFLKDRIYDVGLKRALVKAVESGADRLGWTTGGQQADRYNLRKHVDRIEWMPPESPETPHGTAGSSYGRIVGFKDGKEITSKTVEPKELSDYVGKELAEKLTTSVPVNKNSVSHDPSGLWNVSNEMGVFAKFIHKEEADAHALTHGKMVHSVEGPDLELGGQGLKQLYDRDLHKRLLDIKIGDKRLKGLGVKVGYSQVASGEPDDMEISQEPVTPQQSVHSIDITPELAEAVKRHGVSLYRHQGQPIRFGRDHDLIEVIRRWPPADAAVYAMGVLHLLELRPDLVSQYSAEDLLYLRSLKQQYLPGKFARAEGTDIFTGD